MRQSDISRDLRRLLPLLQQHLPVPVLLPLASEEVDLEELRTAIQGFLEDLLAILDATEQQIERPKDNETQREYYSGKKKRHTIKTQVVVNAVGEVAAMTPGEAGKTSDIEIARRSQIVDVLPEDTHLYDDKGYVGLEKEVACKTSPTDPEPVDTTADTAPQPRIIIHTPTKKPRGGELSPEQKEQNKQIGKVRILVEHVLGHLKNWRILAERFRCALTIYTDVFRTIAGLLNFQKRARRRSVSA